MTDFRKYIDILPVAACSNVACEIGVTTTGPVSSGNVIYHQTHVTSVQPDHEAVLP